LEKRLILEATKKSAMTVSQVAGFVDVNPASAEGGG
jgi:hypothetical protein